MKRNVVVAALTAVSLAFSGLAFAQGPGGHAGQDMRPGPDQRSGPPGQQKKHQPAMRQLPRGHGPNSQSGPAPRSPMPMHTDERGAGPDHNFHRGGRLPMQYRSHQYVVNDWRGHHLSAPPRGQQWVQTGADYVLVAIATGLIVQVLLNH